MFILCLFNCFYYYGRKVNSFVTVVVDSGLQRPLLVAADLISVRLQLTGDPCETEACLSGMWFMLLEADVLPHLLFPGLEPPVCSEPARQRIVHVEC